MRRAHRLEFLKQALERTGGEKYATVFYSLLTRDGRLSYVNAGHVPPYRVARDGTVRRLGPGSIVLVEDTRGKGHRVLEVGSEASFQAVVELSD